MSRDAAIVACKDIECSWASVPHFHEDGAIYPLPPDAPEWTPHLLSGFEDVTE